MILRPRGKLVVVGLSANKTVADHIWSAMIFPVVGVNSRVRGENRDVGLPTLAPRESLREIRETVGGLLPDSRIRRGLYYRYILTWTKPREARS